MEKKDKLESGDDGYVDPPVPIPNTVVKHINAESTWLETAWEDRKLPVRKEDCLLTVLFLLFSGRLGVYVLIEFNRRSTWLEGNMPVACYPEIVRLHIELFPRPAWDE